jgi:hypothetical protein
VGPLRINRVERVCGSTAIQRAYRQWVEEALEGEPVARDDRWSEAIAVGSLAFVETVKNDLGVKPGTAM